MRVFVNPGHAKNGIPDPGAVNQQYGYKEAIIASDVAKMVVDYLRKADCEAVSYQSNSLMDIARTANRWQADLFVSIHCNAGGGTGTETFCYEMMTEAERLAECVQKQVVDAIGLTDRGVKYKGYTVLVETDMPAALIELGFMDSTDIFTLIDKDKQREYAKAIARGVTDYITRR